jgi:hypothetical protein
MSYDDLRAQIEALSAKYSSMAEHPLAPHDDEARRARHQEQMAELDRIKASLQQTQAALDPEKLNTTMAQVRRMAEKDLHPTWMHAAYADLAQRLARVEETLEELGASMSLLHTKMETIIGQLAAYEHQDRAE